MGVIAALVQQLGELNRLVRGAGYPVAASVELRPGQTPSLPDADVWIVNLDLHQEAAQTLVERIDADSIAVIYDEDLQLGASSDSSEKPLSTAEVRQQKERRLGLKLRQLVREPAAAEATTLRRAQKAWVLAASTGGPEAITVFLKGIPADLNGIALFYVQHMENHGFQNLCNVVAKHTHWTVKIIDEARIVRENTLYVVSPEYQFELTDGGVISPLAEPWAGRYRPSIDQVIAKVARVYRQRAGAIVFTGMGDDGAHSVTLMHHSGGQVWVQQPSSCTIDSMPVSVEKKGCVTFSGKPQELAQHFVRFHQTGA